MPAAPKSKATVSIREVAALAGVSLGSASRVINEVPGVTTELRERVMKAIAELGYRPNHAAQSLRLRRSRTIGFMLTDVSNPLYAKLFRAVEERFRAAGYVVLLANSLNKPEWEIDILAMFASRGMDGVLIAPGNERHPQVLAAVKALGMPAVILDRDIATDHDKLQFDHAPGMRHAVSYLLGLGHREIALVIAQTTNRPMRRRLEGFQAAFRAAGVELSPELIVRLPGSMSPAFDAVSSLLDRPQRPTAIVALGTGVISETLNAIHRHRLRIPQDISVVSIGDPDFARTYTPAISALRVDLDSVVGESARLLLDRIEGRTHEGEPRVVKVRVEFIVRESCGPVPGSGG